MKQTVKITFLSIILLPYVLYSQSDTISIYYDIDKFVATPEERKKLEFKTDSLSKIEILSYTDYLGSTTYNLELSKKRTHTIKALLLKNGFDTLKIKNAKGLGEIGEELALENGVPENRRSDIIIHYKKAIKQKKQATEQEKQAIEPNTTLADKINESAIGSTLILKNLSFIPGHHYLMEESLPTLDSLILILQRNPNLKIEIEGHVCCSPGTSDGLDQELNTYNLSEQRAKYIYLKLIENSIEAKRLSYKGMARTKPLFPLEKTTEEQQANRRVEIKIIEK